MINDPIDISDGKTFRQLCLDNIGSDIFICGRSADLIFCSFIRVGPVQEGQYSTDNLFWFRAQHYRDEFEFMIDDWDATRERWLDTMRTKYPEHFDWFLFHPEYFS